MGLGHSQKGEEEIEVTNSHRGSSYFQQKQGTVNRELQIFDSAHSVQFRPRYYSMLASSGDLEPVLA